MTYLLITLFLILPSLVVWIAVAGLEGSARVRARDIRDEVEAITRHAARSGLPAHKLKIHSN